MSSKTNPAKVTADILVVENSPTQAEALRFVLEEKGYQVTIARDGRQALACLNSHQPALIISDINMPEMNGYELCKHLKADEQTRNIPVILLTALSNPEDVLEGLACGADSFITKPYSTDYLLAHIRQTLANYWELRKIDRVRVGVEILFAGKRRFISADQQQMLGLLLSTYEAAVQRNNELVQTQEELHSLNEHLEDQVEERTAALHESEARYRVLAENMSDTIWLMDMNLRTIYISPSVTRLRGFTLEEINTIPLDQQMTPESLARAMQVFAEALSPERLAQRDASVTATIELEFYKKDGTSFWSENSFVLIRDENGLPVNILGIGRDITERKQAEVKIRQRNEDLSLINAINMAINCGEDLETILNLISEETKRIFNCMGTTLYLLDESRERLVMQNLALPPQLVAQIEKFLGVSIPPIQHDIHAASLYRQVLDSKQGCLVTDPDQLQELIRIYINSSPFSEKMRARLKKLVPALVKLLGQKSMVIVPLVSGNEAIGTLEMGSRVMFSEDDLRRFEFIAWQLTAVILRKRAEEALRQSEERYRDIVENSQDLICIHDLQGQVLSVNLATVKLLGYPFDEIVGRNLRNFLAPDREEAFTAYLQEIKEKGVASGFLRVLTRSGEKRIWEFNNNLRTEGVAEPIVRGMARDVTERFKTEKALRQAEDQYRGLFENVPIGLYRSTPAGKFLAVNPALVNILGYACAEELLNTDITRDLYFQPETRQSWVNALLEKGDLRDVESTLRCKDGRQIIIQENTRLIRDAQGKALYFEGVLTDITERKRVEEEIRRRLSELEVLYATSLTVSQSLQPKEIGQKIIEFLSERLQWHHATIRLYHPEDETLELLAFHEPDLKNEAERLAAEERYKSRIMRPGQGLSGWVIQHGQTVYCGDVTKDARYTSVVPGIRSGIYVPLKIGERTIGCLAVESEQVNEFTETDEWLMTTLATQTASALENARLFAEIHQRLVESEAVSRISTAMRTAQSLDEMLPRLLDETLAMLGTDTGMIWLYEATHDELQPAISRGWLTRTMDASIRPGEGIVGGVYAADEHRLSHEFLSDTQVSDSWYGQIPAGWGGVCVPIRTSQTVVGVWCLSVQLPRELTSGEVRILITLAEITGNAIHRMKLNEQTLRQLQRISALHEIDMAISSSVDLGLTLGIVLRNIKTQLKVDAVDVLLLNPYMQRLDYAAGYGFHTPGITRTHLRLGEEFAGKAALERKMVNIPDLAQESGFMRLPLLSSESFVTYFGLPLIAKGQVKGVLEVFHRAPFNVDEEWLDFFETLANQVVIAIDNSQLFGDLQHSNLELSLAYDDTIEGWSRALDLRDKETEGHTQRVTEMTLRLGRAMGLRDAELVHIRRGALLHDIGKMGVPDHILLKPGSLSDEEWVLMRKHPQYAYEMLAPISYLHLALDIPYCHHEKWDGTGYPRGLKGEEIPLAARIFAVVDVWDALTSDRPYRPAWPKEKTLVHIKAGSGSHFDPQVVEAFLATIGLET